MRHWTYPDIEGAINDVNLIEGVLLAPNFGFQPDDIVKLITPEKTTADQILTTLRRELVETASKGDIRLVYAIAPRNARGRVEFSSDFVLVRPRDPSGGSG